MKRKNKAFFEGRRCFLCHDPMLESDAYFFCPSLKKKVCSRCHAGCPSDADYGCDACLVSRENKAKAQCLTLFGTPVRV